MPCYCMIPAALRAACRPSASTPPLRLMRPGDRRPAIEEDGLITWPVLFFYPEASMQHDAVDQFCEEDTFR